MTKTKDELRAKLGDLISQIVDDLSGAWDAAQAEEREACWKIATSFCIENDPMDHRTKDCQALKIAQAIRKRGEKEDEK